MRHKARPARDLSVRRLRETCACGAVLIVTGRRELVELAEDEWVATHAACERAERAS